jgi:hypothetical protein
MYHFVGRAPKVIAFNVNSARLIVVVKKPQVTYGFFS